MSDRLPLAIGLRLLSVAAFAAMGAAIKLAEKGGAGLAESLFFRQLLSLPVVIGFIATGPGLKSVRTQRLGPHLLRTTIGLTSMACMFAAIMMLPLAEATTLQFTVPVFATILSALFLQEQVGWHRWGAVLAGFLGVLVITQPGSGHIPLLGAAVGLTAAALSATVSILIRRLSQSELPSTIVFWFAVLSLPPLLVAFLFEAEPHPPATWAWLVAVGLLGGVGQLAMTSSLKFGPISVVVPMDYSSLIWATLYGWLIFAVLPGLSTWLGAPIIIGSGLYIVLREQLRARSRTQTAFVPD